MSVAEKIDLLPPDPIPRPKKVKLRTQAPSEAEKIATAFGVSPITARILAARGFVADETLKHYITPTLKEGLPSPQGLKNVQRACEILATSIAAKHKIAICCDFDVDGLSGGAQFYDVLLSLGVPAIVFVPDRFTDGYGLNSGMVERAAEQGARILVTIDFGTTNTLEILRAKELGLTTIVIDHHHVGDIVSPADVFINPQQPGCGFSNGILSAAGLVWYLIAALRSHLGAQCTLDPKAYLELACLGTICDMVPLKGANRVIAKRGLEAIDCTTRPGLIALKEVVGVKKRMSCTDVSFGIGPRLNAAGRIVHGDLVIELLTTRDSKRAREIAKMLNELNAERQDTESEVKSLALEQLKKRGQIGASIVVWDEKFHTGVIGIVAQRMVETFYRPTAVLGADSHGVYKGSVRGIKGFSVVEALQAVKKHLIKCGGHDGAGGFSVDAKNIRAFALAFEEECARRLSSLETVPWVEADTEAVLSEISAPLVDELKSLAPFGMGNAQPLVLIKGLKVVEVTTLKNAHLKATLTDGKRFITGLLWRQPDHPAIRRGATINLVCKPDYNNYNGLTELQAIIQAAEVA
jgi:single-stranded-DNA-specific exonuclease